MCYAHGQSGKSMCQGGKPDSGKLHSSYVAPPIRLGACIYMYSIYNIYIYIYILYIHVN